MQNVSRGAVRLGVCLLAVTVPAFCGIDTPEPATFWLVGVGAAGILLLQRIRRKK